MIHGLFVCLGFALTPRVFGAEEAPGSTPTGWELHRRHVESIGGVEAVLEVQALTRVGRVQVPEQGIEAPHLAVWTAAGWVTETHWPGGFVQGQGHQGGLSWARDPNLRQLRGDEAADARRAADLHLLARPERWYAAMDTVGQGVFAEERAWEVRVRPHEGTPFTAWYALDDGRMLGQEQAERGETEPQRLVLRRWERHGELWFAVEILRQRGLGEHLLLVDEIRFEGELPDPPDLELGRRGRAELPLRDSALGSLVEVGLGGDETRWFLLDSGANGVFVSPELEVALGLEPEGLEVRAGSAGGSFDAVRLRALPELNLGGWRWAGPVVVVTELELPAEPPISGVLGTAFFGDAVLELIPEPRFLHLHPAGSVEAGTGPDLAGLVAVELTAFSAGLFEASLEVEGVGKVPVLVDLGASHSVVSWPVANALGLGYGDRRCEPVGEMVGADGRGIRVCELSGVRLGMGSVDLGERALRVANVPALGRFFSDCGDQPVCPAGLVGRDLLADRRLVVDPVGGRLFLEPSASAPEHP